MPLTPVNLKPNEIVSVNLHDAVASAKPELLGKTGAFGSVVFRFDGRTASNAFAASLVRREGHPIDFHFDAYDSGSTAVEGIWYLPAESSTDYLILSNPTGKPVTANLTLSDASGAAHPLSLTLGPGQSQRTNIGEMSHSSAGGAIGGLSLFVAKDGALSATEIVFDETTGFAAIMKLFDREPRDEAKNHVLRAPMMALSQPDHSLGFPNGAVLDPKIFLRNAGSASMVVSPCVNWRNDSDAGTSPLPPITLLPGQINVINLADFQKSGKLPAEATWSTVTLGYTGRRADLVAVAMSYDKTSRYGLQTPFIEGTNRLFMGSMWHADAAHNTLITTGNGGTEKTRAQATLYYNGGTGEYRVEKPLSPGQQLWLDVGQLVRDQVADSDGRTIPPGIMTGSYELRDLDHPLVGMLYEGKLVIDKTYGHASYGCAGCCGWLEPAFDPDSVGLPSDIDYGELVDSEDACSHDLDDITDSMSDWQSSNTAVATLTSPTLNTVAAGTTTGSAEVTLQSNLIGKNCPLEQWSPGQPITVTNNTPILTGIDPSDWPSGATTPSVNFTGEYFGTNAPTLTFSPSSGISYSLVSYNDTQIVANITVASGTPTEDVDVSVTNNGYGGSGFQSGGGVVSPTSAPVYATVRAPLNSPEVTVIAWVNGNAPDLNPLPTGENSTLQSYLQNGTLAQQVVCAIQVTDWVAGFATDIITAADSAYANAWLIKNSANTAPPRTITPSAQNSGGNHRLFNDFGNGKAAYNVGITPDPCNTGILGWASKGQPSQYMGASGTSPSGEVYQLAEGRIGTVGQLGSETINGGRTVPWIWSVIEFNSSGTPTYDDVGMFPTYSVYVNGEIVITYPQSTVAAFIANNQTYQLEPSQIP